MKKITLLALLLCSAIAVHAQQRDEEFLRQNISVLASDSFGGRAPLTKYETKTINHIANQFKELGLKPGNNGSYFQDVPLLKVKTKTAGGAVIVKGAKGTTKLRDYDDIVITSERGKKVEKISNAQYVFAGFGIDAPEYNWNDYKNLDVKNKIVIVLVNDPGFYNDNLFHGKDMTYYGRWTYKIEEARRQGATGVLIIHDEKPASYGWNVCQGSQGGDNLTIYTGGNKQDKLALEGWISQDGVHRLFNAAGVDYDKLVESAKHPDFKPVPLNARSDIRLNNDVFIGTSHNVAAVLPGTDLKNEYIIYSAHWDHLGIGRPVNGDSIYNGASDNASGTAALLLLARKFSEGKLKPRRSILFLAVTSEEAGLLGSEYYSRHPLFPLSDNIVNINIDGAGPRSRSKNVILGGAGDTNTDTLVAEVAAAQGRRVDINKTNIAGLYFRSDHFSFAKVGIPVILVHGGSDLLNPADSTKSRNRNVYHQPGDEYDPSWDLSGSIDDVNLWYGIGLRIGDSDKRPVWLRQNYIINQENVSKK